MVAKAPPTQLKVGGRQGQAFKDKSKPADIRQSNINAAKGKRSLVTQFCTIFSVITEIKNVRECLIGVFET